MFTGTFWGLWTARIPHVTLRHSDRGDSGDDPIVFGRKSDPRSLFLDLI
ncbi:hypothetical protein RSSM_06351 [Rhodopirellula sallentina SM41]|uniref:Uncharacterized protein n=1 Tax=Rhodopirellula sallentina SM41 TaxID=1263870 RepID=M5TSS7_9BACT|nr:hypothetical protein RSSM_06351 [Rhodopirellula sallentina SM41]